MIRQNGLGVANPSRGVVHFRFDEFAVSWAGQGAGAGEFCFGAEDGRLRFTTVDGEPTRDAIPGGEDAEAVNGVAFVGPITAISNRQEIVLRTPAPAQGGTEVAIFPYGAHNVLATAGGDFVAPLGPTGLLKASTGLRGPQRFTIMNVPQQTVDYYAVVRLHTLGQPEVLACATRLDGLAATELVGDGEQGRIRSLTPSGLDIIDVCSLGTGVNPPAVAALDSDGTLILIGNLLSDASPLCITVPGVTGVGYRVFCTRGHILVLTSTGLYILFEFGRRFLSGEPVADTPTRVRPFHLEAVDANIADDRWLLVVLTDGVLRFDLDLLTEDLAAGESVQAEPSGSPVLISPVWEFHQGPMTVST